MVKIKKQSIALVAVLVLAMITSGLLYAKNRNLDSSQPASPDATQAQDINFDPPTAEDAQRAADNKQRLTDQPSQPNASPGTKKSVKPTITGAGQYGEVVEISSFVGGVFEDGGTCTATFTSGGTSFTSSVQAVSNVNTVNCPTISVPISNFNPRGTWSVTISYSSNTAAGTSDPKQVEVN